MSFSRRRNSHSQRPDRARALVLAGLLCALAVVLGPLAAIAAAGSTGPAGDSGGSGGSGLITTSTGGGSALTVGTTTIVATTTTSGTSTSVGVCTEPAVGGVTTSVTTTVAATTVTASSPCQVAPPATISPTAGGGAAARRYGDPFAKRGMWIWELPATDGGNVATIIAQARRYGIGTVYLKSGDGTTLWSQFSPTVVAAFHQAGLKVCAWQYVYGNAPLTEAQVGADSVRDGADCLVIDAETEYQGKYVQAQQYLSTLRAKIGAAFPVALAGFPYVQDHPSFPYSVFLGPNGAQYNLPQMYWQDIGVSVAEVYATTFAFNELYQRPIEPLGQLFDGPPASSVRQFRSIGLAYRAGGLSWWDLQSAGSPQLSAIAAPVGAPKDFTPDRTVASLGRGAVGDLVVLAQEHLWNTPERVTIDGDFGAGTQTAIERFQAAHDLPVSGVVTPQTWTALLRVTPAKVRWTLRGKRTVATIAN